MKNTFAKIALSLTASATIAAPAFAQASDPAQLTEGEVELAEMLEGRIAGEPQTCINTFRAHDFEIIDETALVYERGDTIYVNFTRDPETLDERDGIVTRSFGTQLCRMNIVTKFDRGHGMYTGNIFLTDFIPYRKEG